MQHTMAAKEDSLALQGICCRSPYDILSYDADITTGLPFQDAALMVGSCQRKHCIMERLPEMCYLHHGHSVSGYLYSEVCTFADCLPVAGILRMYICQESSPRHL